MAKTKWVVRVVVFKKEENDSMYFTHGHTFPEFLENLRYAGLVRIHKDDEIKVMFDLYPPAGVDTKIWAEQNARRMESFGYNAVAAPEWKDYGDNVIPQRP